jgi:predicted TIM-barrel fold metal-dependent hydrolase
MVAHTTRTIEFVDAHHHFQDVERNSYPWLADKNAPHGLEGDLAAIRRNYLVADYLADVARFRLVKSVHIQNGWDSHDPAGETRWLQALYEKEGLPHAIVAYANLAAPDVDGLLEAHASCRNLRGIRQILNWHRDPALRVAQRADLMDDPAWRRGFALLRRYDLSFDLQIYPEQIDQACRLARYFPDTLILLNHFGMPIDRSASGMEYWASALRRFARVPNVMIKISGVGLGHPRWTPDDTVPVLLEAIDAFGIERVVFGTNLPVDRLFASADAILSVYETVTAGFSDAERNDVFRVNAERAYRV